MELLAPDVHRLAGGPRKAINTYLVGDVLVDAGTPLAAGRLLRQLRDVPLRAVALTHEHPDHYGGARKVCARRDVELWAAPGTAAAVAARSPAAGPTPLGRVLQRLPGPPAPPVARVLREGDELAAGFRVLETPGHAPEHLAYWREDDRVLICGDVVFMRSVLLGRPGLREPPAALTHDRARNRESIRRIAALSPRLVLAGHGPALERPDALRALAARLA